MKGEKPVSLHRAGKMLVAINKEVKSRIITSALMSRLSPEAIETFLLDQLDRCSLGHNTFTPEALALIVRSGDGILRRTRNLTISSLIEAVRDQTRTVDLKQVNRVEGAVVRRGRGDVIFSLMPKPNHSG